MGGCTSRAHVALFISSGSFLLVGEELFPLLHRLLVKRKLTVVHPSSWCACSPRSNTESVPRLLPSPLGKNEMRAWGMEGGVGKCSRRPSKCKLGSEARSVFIVKVRSVKIYSVSRFGFFLEQTLAWELGSTGVFIYVFVQSSQGTLSWDLVWNVNGGGVGGVRNSGQTALAKVSDRLESWIHWKRKTVSPFRTVSHGRDCELDALGPWRWTLRPDGPQSARISPWFVMLSIKCQAFATRNLKNLKKNKDGCTECIFCFGETLRPRDSFQPSFGYSLE